MQDQNISTQRIGMSDIEQSPVYCTTYIKNSKVVLAQKKDLRPHQKEVLRAVVDGFAAADRGTLIMA